MLKCFLDLLYSITEIHLFLDVLCESDLLTNVNVHLNVWYSNTNVHFSVHLHLNTNHNNFAVQMFH